ncbi:MAG: C40 family peptidase [Chloroflexia bacterium]|nr:C40 family peptidase [Chloroflexia bacterium]
MPAEVPAETPAPVPAPETASYDSANVIATAWVAGTDGDGAVCRAGMDFAAADLGWLAEGSAVDVIGDTVGEWQPVGCAGVAAFIHASFIAWEPPATVDASSDDNETTDPATTDPATVDASDDDVTTETATTDAVPVEATPRNNRERGNGESDAVDSSDDLDSSDDGAGNDGGGGGSGQDVADFAMQFEGYPYVYAGEGPYAFDCSGLTMFVIQNTLGKSITHDMFVQYDMGQQVDRSELQPGDLVFFQNTFRPGMSHNGIYIGGGQMIHAENESTGVKVSDINSDYYSSRWYGAVRFS